MMRNQLDPVMNPALSCGSVDSLICEYLLMEGLEDVASIFRAEISQERPLDEDMLLKSKVRTRAIRDVVDGNIDSVLDVFRRLDDPIYLDTVHGDIFTSLISMKFIQCIRCGDISGAISIARNNFLGILTHRPTMKEMIEELSSLLIFSGGVEKSQLSYLTCDSHKFEVAKEVLNALLKAQGGSLKPKLAEVVQTTITDDSK